MGSGTALFECETLGRKYIGIDINPEMINYVTFKKCSAATHERLKNNFILFGVSLN
jgi:DNA modification methylase